MSEPTDLTVEILRQIRDEIVATRTDLGARIDQTNGRLDNVEQALVDLAQPQRFVVRHLSALTTRDRELEHDVDELRVRVDAIERRLGERT